MLDQLKADLAASSQGKWRDFSDADSTDVMLPNGDHILTMCGMNDEADARLICNLHNAAPALIEAVEAMEEVLRISDRKHDAWDRAYAALAKLKGETK